MTIVLRHESFRAMGTICSVTAAARPCDDSSVTLALAAARREVMACENALSRFDTQSDLSRLNRAAGSWVVVGTRLIEALLAARRARIETRGRFDPTILAALTAAGYDRSFELLTHRARVPLESWQPGARIDVDPDSNRARVECGAQVDLGGIGKGFAATRALETMRTAWPALTGALVDLGGDIALWGQLPEGGPWLVDIADPRTPDAIAGTLELTRGGVATSGRDTRRFGPDGEFHHLIDPATGLPARVGPLAVTVVAPTATQAEIFATALACTDVTVATELLRSRPEVTALVIPLAAAPITIGRLPLSRERQRQQRVMAIHQGKLQWA